MPQQYAAENEVVLASTKKMHDMGLSYVSVNNSTVGMYLFYYLLFYLIS